MHKHKFQVKVERPRFVDGTNLIFVCKDVNCLSFIRLDRWQWAAMIHEGLRQRHNRENPFDKLHLNIPKRSVISVPKRY